MAVISEYSVMNAVTGENIQVFGELSGSPYKFRYNKKIAFDKQVKNQYAGLMYKGTFTVDYLDEANYKLIFNAWKNGNDLFISECNGNRLLLTLEGEEFPIKPKPNNTDKSVYYTGSFNVEGSYSEEDKI